MKRGSRGRGYPFLLMSVGTAWELWIWLVTGASERLAALSVLAPDPDGNRATTLRSEERFLRRLKGAFEHYVQRRGVHSRDWSVDWTSFAQEGVDEIGLALFSRYLGQQAEYWTALLKTSRGPAVVAGAHLVAEFSELFHQRLGLSPEDVARRMEDLFIEEDPRAEGPICRSTGFRADLQRPEEGLLTKDELEDRDHVLAALDVRAGAGEMTR